MLRLKTLRCNGKHAPRTVGPAPSNRLQSKRCAIEFCCPPVPLHLVCAKFVNALIMPMASHVVVSKEDLGRVRPNLTGGPVAGRTAGSPTSRSAAIPPQLWWHGQIP